MSGSCYKCPECGVEFYTSGAVAVCHRCSHVLGIDDMIFNIDLPDFIIPFSVTRKAAEKSVRKYISKRSLCISPLVSHFNKKYMSGVYLPCGSFDSQSGYDIGDAVFFNDCEGDGYNIELSYGSSVYCPVWLYSCAGQCIIVDGVTGIVVSSSLNSSYYNLLSYALILQILCVFIYYLATVYFGIGVYLLKVLWLSGVLFFLFNFWLDRRNRNRR